MTEKQVMVGKCYAMPSGINRRVIEIAERANGSKWVRLEKLNGVNLGQRSWESMRYFVSVAEPLND